MSKPKYIDADMLEKDGWNIQRIRRASLTEMIYETKKPTDFPAADVEPRWIPVTERLPEESGEYLVTIWSMLNFSWFYKDDGVWSFRNADITAWMYLPEPYKGGEKE